MGLFARHEPEKDQGKTDSSWEEWLKENVGISAQQGRKIRDVAHLLVPYPGFRRLVFHFLKSITAESRSK